MKKGSNSKQSRSRSDNSKRQFRLKRATELILPTAPNQYGTVALVQSDFNSAVTKQLAPFDTIGTQNFFWRVTLDGTTIRQQAVADTTQSYFFALNQFNGYTDMVSCFDQYRLKAISVSFSPFMTSASGQYLPRLFSCLDYDDSSSVGRVAIEQYDTCVVSPPGTGVVRTLVPRIAMAAYSGSAFSDFANMREQWLDAASSDVQHYGVKVVIEGGSTGQTVLQTFVVTITSFWEFRATR